MLRDLKIKFYKFWCEYFNNVCDYFFKKAYKHYYIVKDIINGNMSIKDKVNKIGREDYWLHFYRINYEMGLKGFEHCLNKLKEVEAD